MGDQCNVAAGNSVALRQSVWTGKRKLRELIVACIDLLYLAARVRSAGSARNEVIAAANIYSNTTLGEVACWRV